MNNGAFSAPISPGVIRPVLTIPVVDLEPPDLRCPSCFPDLQSRGRRLATAEAVGGSHLDVILEDPKSLGEMRLGTLTVFPGTLGNSKPFGFTELGKFVRLASVLPGLWGEFKRRRCLGYASIRGLTSESLLREFVFFMVCNPIRGSSRCSHLATKRFQGYSKRKSCAIDTIFTTGYRFS
jgi:hypothetical protein